jgi:hypothetical protein
MSLSVDLYLKLAIRRVKPSILIWRIKGYPTPAPNKVKWNVLKRNCIKSGDWIETGTYLGETTSYLAKLDRDRIIYSIEPAERLFIFNSTRFKKEKNIKLIYGTSEDKLLFSLNDSRNALNFWLDGHYSGDVTYQGENLSPIKHELNVISQKVDMNKEMVIFIDDFRLFIDDRSGYPSMNLIIDWAKRFDFMWSIEYDIIILRKMK